nr:pre-mRNA-processing factor 39-like isoform X2 [Rhipicephalus microplus]
MHSSKNGSDSMSTSSSASADAKGGVGDSKKEGKESVELEKYWQVVRNNPADFTGWTYLLQYVEQENNLAAAREAFDKFFSYYPYCYGYWKKYADMEKKLCSIEKAEQTFERGVAAIPLSVDLWIHYINFVKLHFKDEEGYYAKVKNLFERAIESSGQDFRSDRLWDMFVTWELENKNLKEVTAIYERVLQVPTQLYGHHFEKFQEHVKTHLPKDILSTDEFLQLRQQYMESMRKATPVGPSGQSSDEAGAAQMEIDEDDGDAPPPGVDDAPPPGVEDATKEDTKALKNDNEAKYIRDKVVEKRRELFKANESEVGRRWAFEEGIKRPYFHVKPLERLQLKNWREYLDFETQNGNHARTVILYERCLIACALYEDMWMKYIKYLDTAEPEKVNEIFRRACTTHLVRKPSISLAWAAYEEKHGRFEEASTILAEMEARIPDLLEPTLRRINVERRRGCLEKVEELYRKCISQTESTTLKSHFAGKLARFLHKVQNKLEDAKEVLKEALDREPVSWSGTIFTLLSLGKMLTKVLLFFFLPSIFFFSSATTVVSVIDDRLPSSTR